MTEQQRPDETMTAFTIRRMRNEIIGQCEAALANSFADRPGVTDDEVIVSLRVIRALKDVD